MLFMKSLSDQENSQIKYFKTTSADLYYEFYASKNKKESEAERKFISHLRNIEKQVNSLCNISQENQNSENMKIKWNFAAKVMDRLFLIISLIYFALTFSLLILSNKNFYNAV